MDAFAQVGGHGFSPLSAFVWAAGGSFALEIIDLNQHFKSEDPRGLPSYYKSWGFWLVRLTLAAFAGALAMAESANNPLLAINIGAATPAILRVFEGGKGEKTKRRSLP